MISCAFEELAFDADGRAGVEVVVVVLPAEAGVRCFGGMMAYLCDDCGVGGELTMWWRGVWGCGV